MTYGQDPMMLAKKGNSWNPSQNTGLDENLVRAIAQYLSQGGRLRDAGSPGLAEGLGQGAAEDAYSQDAARSRAQAGMMQDGSPNALQGGLAGPPTTGLYGTDTWAGMSPRARDEYTSDFAAVGDPQGSEWAALEGYLDSPQGQQGEIRPSYAPGRANYDSTTDTGFENLPHQVGSMDPSLVRGLQEFNQPTPMQDQALAVQGPGPMEQLATKMSGSAEPKKKGEYSDFFKLLKAAKSGDKTTKKSIKDLAKQLEASGGEVPVS